MILRTRNYYKLLQHKLNGHGRKPQHTLHTQAGREVQEHLVTQTTLFTFCYKEPMKVLHQEADLVPVRGRVLSLYPRLLRGHARGGLHADHRVAVRDVGAAGK